VPNLFEQDQITQIIDDCRSNATKAGYEDLNDSIMQYFISKVRENIHICLTFSPVGGAFRKYCL